MCHVPNDVDEVLFSAWPPLPLCDSHCILVPRLSSLSVSVSVSPSGDLQLGSNAILQCRVKGLDPGPTVQWMRPDGNSHTGPALTPVASSDAGTWVCKFSNGGVTYNDSLVIKVEGRTLSSTKVFAYGFYHNKNHHMWPLAKARCCVFLLSVPPPTTPAPSLSRGSKNVPKPTCHKCAYCLCLFV